MATLGDNGFRGVDMRRDPGLVTQGLVAESVNCRFRDGVGRTRRGSIIPPHLNQLRPALTGDDIHPWVAVYGVAPYRNPNDQEFVLIATGTGVWACREGNPPRQLPFPAGFTATEPWLLRTPVTMVQAFDKMLMLRGHTRSIYIMHSLDTGFEDMVPRWATLFPGHSQYDEVAWGPWLAIDTLTRRRWGDYYRVVATVTEDHRYQTGDDIQVRDVGYPDYQGRFIIERIDDRSFAYWLPFDPGGDVPGGTCSNNQNFYIATTDTTSEPGTDEDWIIMTATGAPVTILPNASTGVYAQGRVVVATSYDGFSDSVADPPIPQAGYSNKVDYLAATLIFDYIHTQWSNLFRISKGLDDEIIELAVVADNQLVVFKDKSVHLLTNLGQDASLDAVVLQTLIPNYGITGLRAYAVAGKDVLFMADKRGVMSISQTEQSRYQGVDLPFSDAVQPLIDRIDWRYGNAIRMAYWENRLYVAVPLDNGRNVDLPIDTTQTTTATNVYFVDHTGAPYVDDTGTPYGYDDFVPSYYVNVVPGKTYFYKPGDDSPEYIKNGFNADGTDNLVEVEGDFVARVAQLKVVLDFGDPPGAFVLQEVRIGNNSIMVYDFLQQAWAGHDTGHEVAEFFKATYNGVERLHYASLKGSVHLLEEGFAADEKLDRSAPNRVGRISIPTTIVTRGYSVDDMPNFTGYGWGSVTLGTWAPRYSISTVTEGVGEGQPIRVDVTRSRSKYTRPFNRLPYDPSNFLSDHGEPYREDYSVEV